MKRFKKILSLMIAVVAVFMIGFTTVSAEKMPGSIVVTNDHDDFNIRDGFPFYTKSTVVNGQRRYVFCLDSHKDIADGQSHSLSTSLYSDKVAKVNSVLTKAYSFGLGTGGNHTINGKSISEKDLYGVTQMVIWDIIHPNDTGVNGDGYVDSYRQWISSNGYQSIFDTLKNANDGSVSYSVKLTGDTTMKKEGNFLVSGDLKVEASNVPAGTTFTVNVSDIVGGKAGIDKNNSDKWNYTQTVVNGDTIKVRMPIVSGTKDYSVKVTISSGSFAAGWSTGFYTSPISNGQNIGLAIPSTSSVKGEVKVVGSYTPNVPKGPKTTDIDVSKTDATGQKELPGAHIQLYSFDGKLYQEWDSTTESHKVKGLETDKIYVIKETVAPKGYQKLETNIFFKVDSDGNAVVCKIAEAINGVCVPMSNAEKKLTIKNNPTKLLVSKKSGTGQGELIGAHMQITDVAGNVVSDINGDKLDWISNGVTKEIEGLVAGKIYKMVETSTKDGYDPLTVNIYFRLDEAGKVQLCNVKNNDESTAECSSNIQVKENDTTFAEIAGEVLVIRNYPSKTTTKVVISKLDITNGKEIPGAHLQILDENGNVVVEWDSTEEPYIIEGLEPGKYVLVETLPASNYNVEMIIDGQRTSRYEFEITEGGTTKIDVYNELIPVPNTGLNISASYVIGGLVMLIGAGTIVLAKKKEIM